MTGITLTTAIKGSFGDLEYYLTTMKAGQAVKTLRPLGELQPEPDRERIESMVQYLRQDERFLSPLIVAVAGENPGFISLEIDEPDQIFPPPPQYHGYGYTPLQPNHRTVPAHRT